MPVVVDVPLGRDLPEQEVVSFFGGHEIPVSREGEIIFSAPEQDRDPARISVPIQNGMGLAEVKNAVLVIDGRRTAVSLLPVGSFTLKKRVESEGHDHLYSPLYLPPKGRDRLATQVLRASGVWELIRDAVQGGHAVTVEIEFADVSGRQLYETALRLYQSPDGMWRAVRDWTRPKVRMTTVAGERRTET